MSRVPGDLIAETVSIEGFEGKPVPAYLARPTGQGPFPMVVVLHHRDGWDYESKDIVLRFASEGYACIMPNLHDRWAPGEPFDVVAKLSLDSGGVSNDQVVADTAGAIAYLRAQEYTSDKVGVIGYCSGGRQAFYVSTAMPLDATIMCYGPKLVAAESDLTPITPISPITRAHLLTGPVLGLYGAEDRNPAPEMVSTVSAELDRLGKKHTFISFPDAGHAFFAVNKPSYRVAAANEGWGEVFRWFGTYLRDGDES